MIRQLVYTGTLWPEIAVVSVLCTLGHILPGHFEERTPRLENISRVPADTHHGLSPFSFLWTCDRICSPGRGLVAGAVCSPVSVALQWNQRVDRRAEREILRVPRLGQKHFQPVTPLLTGLKMSFFFNYRCRAESIFQSQP